MTKKVSNIIVIVALVLVVLVGLIVALTMSKGSGEYEFSDATFKYAKVGDTVKVVEYIDTEKKKEIEIPDKVNGMVINTIGKDAFKDNNFIEKVTLGAFVTTIEEGAFRDCTKLATVKTTGLVNIGKDAFNGAKELSYFDMPATLETIGEGAFKSCERLYKFAYKFNPDYTVNSALKSVGANAFAESKLNHLIIPSSLKTIGKRAFADAALRYVYFYEGVSEIGEEAFTYSSNTNSNMQVYTYDKTLVTATAPNIDNLYSAFKQNTFPNSLRKIGNRAFKKTGNSYSRMSINSIEFGENLESIGDEAFVGANCYYLSFKNPKTTLGAYAFSKLTDSQVSVDLPAELEVIPDGLFYHSNLKYNRPLKVPASVKSIGMAAFSGGETEYKIEFVAGSVADTKYQYLKSTDFQGLLSKDGKVLYSVIMSSNSTKFNIPGTVEVIEPYAFTNVGKNTANSDVLDIRIGVNVKEIKKNAFTDSNIVSIYLMHGDNDTIKIDKDAFMRVDTTNAYTIRVHKHSPNLLANIETLFKGVDYINVNDYIEVTD